MKTNLSSTKLTGWKMLVVATMLMLAAANVNAQNPGRHHHGPPPLPPYIDSIIAANIDSFLAHHGDTIPFPHFPPFPIDTTHHHDTIPAPPVDTIHHHHHDTIPTPPPPPHHRDTIIFPHDTFIIHHDTLPIGPGCHRDSTGGGRPPFPPDTTGGNGGGHHDTIPSWPPFPPDTTGGNGGHHYDSIPFPPFPPDTGWTGGNPPTPPFPPDTVPHHKDLLVGADNAPASISIFPNPVVNTSTMRIQNTSNTVTFRMYDMSGRKVMELLNLSNGDNNLNKGNLTPGIYLYEMIDGNTIASTGKVLIQ